MKGLWQSNYKHIHVELSHRDQWFECLRVASSTVDGRTCDASSAFLAFAAGTGSDISVISHSSPGKAAPSMPVIRAHANTITDMEFYPFNNHCLVSIDGRFDN
jgi:coronin-7